MLLGEDKDTAKQQSAQPGGKVSGIKRFKEKWANLDPKKQRTIVLLVICLVIVAVAGLGYQSRQGKRKKTARTSTKHTREISLDSNLIEKSLFRQAQDTLNRQNKLIAQMRQELNNLKRNRNNRSVRTSASTKQTKKQKVKTNAKRTSVAAKTPLPPPPPPQPQQKSRPLYIPPPPVKGNAQAKGKVYGGIAMVSGTTVKSQKTQQGKKKGYRIYLPPSFMEATLLSGLDAPTTTAGKSNPVPVLLRIKNLAILPNRVKANLKGCFVLGEGRGNLASERVDIRLLTLSCVAKNGTAVIDQAIKGYVVDEDGKVGLRGIVAAKMGAMLARSALAGFLGGVGDAVRSSSLDLQTTALGTQTQVWSKTDTENLVRGGIGGGISQASKDLEKFYLQLAQQTLPVIQVGATKTVTVVISEGAKLEVKNAEVVN